MKIDLYVLTKAEYGSNRLIRIQKLYRSQLFLSRYNQRIKFGTEGIKYNSLKGQMLT
jgi:hypothetical protein